MSGIERTLADGRAASHSDGGILTLTLTSPETYNSVNAAVLDALAAEVESVDPSVRVIVLRGAGRAFCSGADLGNVEVGTVIDGAPTIDGVNRLVAALTESSRPVVAVVQGPCAGIGVPIALAADLVIASTAAFFQLAFTKIGLLPDGGATALVAASVGRTVALRMGLLAERLSAEEACSLGLIARVSAPEELDATATAVIEALAHGSAPALHLTKAAINAATLGSLRPAFAGERAGQLRLLVGADFAEGVRAFQEKRPPRFVDPTE